MLGFAHAARISSIVVKAEGRRPALTRGLQYGAGLSMAKSRAHLNGLSIDDGPISRAAKF